MLILSKSCLYRQAVHIRMNISYELKTFSPCEKKKKTLFFLDSAEIEGARVSTSASTSVSQSRKNGLRSPDIFKGAPPANSGGGIGSVFRKLIYLTKTYFYLNQGKLEILNLCYLL